MLLVVIRTMSAPAPASQHAGRHIDEHVHIIYNFSMPPYFTKHPHTVKQALH